MPRLLAFLPCDNVLISGGVAQSASLIVIYSQVVFPPGLPPDLPPKAVAPLRWYIFTQWEIDESEVGIEYQQRVHMDGFDGTRLLESHLSFTGETGKPIHRTMIGNAGFPIVPSGRYRLKLSIKAADDNEWTEAGDYPLNVMHAPAPEHESGETVVGAQ